MQKKIFVKNDSQFTCARCGASVERLLYSSRDHCNVCLSSLHVDVTPGDRAHPCKGLLKPISAVPSAKKGYVITYSCSRCGKILKNKAAADDNFAALISLSNNTYEQFLSSLIHPKN